MQQASYQTNQECMLTKTKAKYRVPWKLLVVMKKRNNEKNISLLSKIKEMPTRRNLRKRKAKRTEYIKGQIDKVINLEKDLQSRLAWQIVNEVSERKGNSKAKLRTACQEERLQK